MPEGTVQQKIALPAPSFCWLVRKYDPSVGDLTDGEYVSKHNYDALRVDLLAALTQLHELREASEWVSVEDRLPEERIPVLACCRKGLILVSSWFCWFPERGDSPLWHNVLVRDYGDVTHWRHLPKPPKPSPASAVKGE